MKKNLGLFIALLISFSFVSFLPTPFIAPVIAQTDHVVINEFQAKGTEWIELYNPTASAVDVTGWIIGDGEGNETLDGDWSITSIAAGAYVSYSTGLDLSNSYDEIFLWDASDNLVDDVYYGMSDGNRAKGGCPVGGTGSDGRSSARAPNGHDTDDYAADWTIALTGTPGAANNAPAPNLGGEGVIINEYLLRNSDSSNNYTVELYNPTGSPINVTYWWLTDDSDGYYNITIATEVPAGGFALIPSGRYATGDILSLFTDTHVRADQLGLEDLTVDGESWQRGPADGQGPNVGYDYVSSSGVPTHLLQAAHTLGSTNTPSYSLTVVLVVDDFATPQSSSWQWTAYAEDLYGSPLPGVSVTAEYAQYNTSTWTQFAAPTDDGMGGYDFDLDVSSLSGSYHLRVNGTLSGYNNDSVTVYLGIIGPETIVVRWDAAHGQYSGHLGSLVDGTQDVWRNFPDCVLIQNNDPFTDPLLAVTDILIIPYIQTDLTSSEMLVLDLFLQGGGVVWWGGYYNMNYFNHTMNNMWIDGYGLDFLNGTQTFDTSVNICDPTDNTGPDYYPIFKTFPNPHFLLTDITELSISGTTQIHVDSGYSGVSILATGDAVDTYWDADGSGTNNAGDINGTECVPLAMYEASGSRGLLVVSGASNMLYEFDLAVGKAQFWENMYYYRLITRTGVSYTISDTDIDVDLAVSNEFDFRVTVSAVAIATLRNVIVTLSYSTNFTLVSGTTPALLGDISPGNSEYVDFSFTAAVITHENITVTISVDNIPDIVDRVTVTVSLTTTPPPPIPVELILLAAGITVGVIIVIVIIYVLLRRRPPE